MFNIFKRFKKAAKKKSSTEVSNRSGSSLLLAGPVLTAAECNPPKKRYGILPSVLEVEKDAFSKAFKGEFWCVKGSAAVDCLAALCPESKLVLFETEDGLNAAWKKKKDNETNWAQERKALSDKQLYKVMKKTGWTYEEAASRAEQAYMAYGKTGREFAAGNWRNWFGSHTDETPEGTHIAWRKAEVDKLDQALKTGVLEPVQDTPLVVPRLLSARKYMGSKNLAAEIAAGKITLKSICDFMDSPLPESLADQGDTLVTSVALDPRQVVPGSVYFCWREKGISPRNVKRSGAICVFGDPDYGEEFIKAGLAYVPCYSMEACLVEFASLWRRQFPKAKSVCITGSVGKTTTTEMINHVALSSFKSICIWVNKNLPHQAARFLQALDEETGVYVQEASGASVGLMEKTSRIVNPDIFVVTNVGSGHIGKHGGNRTSLLYEKITCDRTAPKGALGVINYDDELLRKVPFQHEVAWFSLDNPEADFHGENIIEEDGCLSFEAVEKDGTRTPITVHTVGLHNVYDALAAFIVGLRLGLDRTVIANAIGAYRSAGVRQNLVEIAGRRVFLDCYSATEESMRTALETAKSFHVKDGGRRIIVLGDIPDLDARSLEIHKNVGRTAKAAENVDEVIFYGSMMADAAQEAQGGKPLIRHTSSRKELESWLSESSRNDIVIFKASHKMELHRVADDWLGTTFELDDLRSPVSGRPTKDSIKYINVDNYGSCASESRSSVSELIIGGKAGDMPVRLVCSKAFEGESMEGVCIEAPVISIGKDAFSGCRKLSAVDLPETLYYIGVGAFRDCQSLEDIVIPAGCATVDANAFAGCKNLSYVKLPASLLSIGEGAFDSDYEGVFECPENSFAAEKIASMCPKASIKLVVAKEGDVCKPMPDLTPFVTRDKVYSAEDNIDSPAASLKAAPEKTENKTKESKKKQKEIQQVFYAEEKLFQGKIPADAKVQKVSITAVGDCTFGKNHKMSEKNSWGLVFQDKGPEYFFSGVKHVFDASDITIANLEGALSDNPVRQADFYRQRANRVDPKKYCHLGETRYIEAMTKGGVDVATFANNHNMDYGVAGYLDTLNACRENNLPVAHYEHVVRKRVGDIQVGILSLDFTYLEDKIGEGHMIKAIADLRRDCQLVVACIHWGQNYKEKASKAQERLGHLCIDLGADVVFGSHAHILQGIERYKGRYIFYSMGNFCYGGRSIPKDNDTMIAQQTFTFVDGKLLVDDAVKVVPCWMSGKMEINDFRPVVKTGEEGQAVIDKINERSLAYNMKFDAQGKPVVEPATDIRNQVPVTPYSEDVPAIIYTLTDVYPVK